MSRKLAHTCVTPEELIVTLVGILNRSRIFLQRSLKESPWRVTGSFPACVMSAFFPVLPPRPHPFIPPLFRYGLTEIVRPIFCVVE